MKYRIKKNQLFRKKLEMPDRLINKVYSNTLSFEEYIEYDLEDKVPTSCLNELHRNIVDKFGIEKCKDIDWELIDLKGYELSETISDISPNSNNINDELYKFVRTDMIPKEYTKKMKEKFSEYVLEDEELEQDIKDDFNSGCLKVNELVKIWKYVKDKNLSLCLKNDETNIENVTEQELKKFMNEYDCILSFLDDPSEIYNLIINCYRNDNEENINGEIKDIVEDILERSLLTDERKIDLTNDQYKVLFKYSSIKEYLYKKLGEEKAEELIKQLNGKELNYLFEISIPFNILIEEDVLKFIYIYGLINVVNFEEENGNYFTKNNCELLKKMYDMYIRNAENETDKAKTIFTKNPYGITGNYVERDYTKEEFYEAIKRMLIFGPTNPKYIKVNIDYSDIEGEFRELNPELFINKEAPEEFQKAFYSKSLTPLFVRDNYNCISYLIGKKLSSIFKPLSVRISNSEDGYYYRYENIYKYLEEKFGFEETIKIITDYADVFEILFNSYDKICKLSYIEPIQLKMNNSLEEIITIINDKLYELIIKANIKYSSNLSKTMREKYSHVFMSYRAPKELHEKFYNRKINAKYIIENKNEKKYFEGLDIELFFNYMPIVLVDEQKEKNNKKIENLILFVKKLFGNEEGLNILLDYHLYLDKVNDKMGFSKVEFRENITKEEFLIQIDCLIYLNIIRGEIIYDENMPNHFKKAYPSLFLSEDIATDIKYKFYNRLYTLEDFYNNPVLLKHFNNTDIAASLDTTFSYMIGLFSGKDFLDLINICGENIKSEIKLFNYIRTKTEDLLSIKNFSKLLYEYFTDNNEDIRYLVLLKKLGVDNKHIKNLSERFERILKTNNSININNRSLNGRIISDSIIKEYGYDVINELLKYNTNAYKTIIDCSNRKDKLIKQWIDYLKKLPIYNTSIMLSAFTSYNNMLSLITELLNNTEELDDDTLYNLKQVILSNNKYIVTNINNLINYDKYVKKCISDKLKSSNIDVVKEGLLELLFNISLKDATNIFKSYGLTSILFTKKYINNLTCEQEAIIMIIREIIDTEDLDELQSRFSKVKEYGNICNGLTNIKYKLRNCYGKLLCDKLTDYIKPDETIPALENIVIDDIDNEYVKKDTIDIVNLNNKEFNLLVYSITKNEDVFKVDSIDLINNPWNWNKMNNNLLSMNLISNKNMGCINHGDNNSVYYGFNDITSSSLIIESRRDINIEYNPNDLMIDDINSEYMIPDMLNLVSTSYNTVLIDIDTSNSSNFNHRIQPTCIVCFDNNINNESKLAAQYFNIPIYLIDRDNYNLENEKEIEKYEESSSRINTNEIDKIIYLKDLDLNSKYKLILSKLDKLSNEDRNELCEYLNILLSTYSIHNDISNIDLSLIESNEEVLNEDNE